MFADQCGGEEPSRATSSVGDRGEWAQAVGMMMVAGIRGGLHETDVWMMIRVRAGQARVMAVQADGIVRHAMGRAIQGVTRTMGATADAAAPITGEGAPAALRAAAGMTHAAAGVVRQTALVIGVIARCVAGVHRCVTIGTRAGAVAPVASVAPVVRDTLVPRADRHRAVDSGATSHGAAARLCAIHVTHGLRAVAEDLWLLSRRKASSPSGEA